MVTFHRRLFAKFLVGDGCWEWTAYKAPNGYGRFNINNTPKVAHRVVYELIVGPIPDGLDLDHLCRNRACVNPAHLEPVTRQENSQRGLTGAHNSSKMRCDNGHPYTPENTYITPATGFRSCRTCRAASSKRRNSRA